MVRIDRVADGTIGHPAKTFHISDRRFYILHIVQRIEYAHDIQSRFYGVATESFNELIRIRIVTEQVTSA